MELLTHTLLTVLLWLQGITGNLGWSIIAFTLLVRTVLLPLTLPSLRAMKKMQGLQPELKKLKEKHGKDNQAYQKAQMELYKKYNVNPLAGCIPQIAQLIVLIGLYRVLTNFLQNPEVNGATVATMFFNLNLAQPDPRFVLPVLAGVSQLILSLMVAPGGETLDIVPNESKNKKIQEDNKKEEDVAEMAATMQKQMLFMMPIMTGIIALRFPSGLALYWVVTTVYSIAQQYAVSGWGGLTLYLQRLKNLSVKTA